MFRAPSKGVVSVTAPVNSPSKKVAKTAPPSRAGNIASVYVLGGQFDIKPLVLLKNGVTEKCYTFSSGESSFQYVFRIPVVPSAQPSYCGWDNITWSNGDIQQRIGDSILSLGSLVADSWATDLKNGKMRLTARYEGGSTLPMQPNILTGSKGRAGSKGSRGKGAVESYGCSSPRATVLALTCGPTRAISFSMSLLDPENCVCK